MMDQGKQNTAVSADQDAQKQTPVFENNTKTHELTADRPRTEEELKLDDSPSKTADSRGNIQQPSVASARQQELVKEEYQDVIEESIRRAEQILAANESPKEKEKNTKSKKMMIEKQLDQPQKQQSGAAEKSDKGKSFTFGNKELENPNDEAPTETNIIAKHKETSSSSIMRDTQQDINDEPDRKSSSSIDTNELTDMDRKDDQPQITAPPDINLDTDQIALYRGDNTSNPTASYQAGGNLSSTKEQDSYSNNLFAAESKEPQTMSQDSFNPDQAARVKELKQENQQQKKTIADLKAMLRAKDVELSEMRAFYQNQENKRRKIGGSVKNSKIVQRSKINKDLDVKLPVLPDRALHNNKSQLLQIENQPRSLKRNDWSIGKIGTRNHRLQNLGKPGLRGQSDSGDISNSASQNTSELPPIIKNRNLQYSDTQLAPDDSVGSSGKRIPDKSLNLQGNKSPIVEKNKKFKVLENNFSKNRDKYALAKLEALKFKMQLQNKNLRLLTQQDDLMQNIYKEEKHNVKAKPLRRENKAFQTQQILRIEKDLERTSKQLQNEIASIQDQDRAILPEKLLSEIDVLFDEAENYFAKKQQEIVSRTNIVKKGYGKVQSKINTNLKSLESQDTLQGNQYNSQPQVDHQLSSIDANESNNKGGYFNPYDEAGINHRNELQEIHKEREDRLKKRKQDSIRASLEGDVGGSAQKEPKKIQTNSKVYQSKNRSYQPVGSKNNTEINKTSPQQHQGVLKYKDYDINYLKEQEKKDIDEIQQKYMYYDKNNDNIEK